SPSVSNRRPSKLSIRPRRHDAHSHPPIAPALSVAAMLQPAEPQSTSQACSELLDLALPIDATSLAPADNPSAFDLYPIAATVDFDMSRRGDASWSCQCHPWRCSLDGRLSKPRNAMRLSAWHSEH